MSGRRHARYTQEEIKLILDNWHIQDQEHREAICRQMGRDFDSVNQKFYAILRSLKVKPKDYYAYKGLPPGVSLFAEDTEEKSETRTPKAAEPAAAAAEPRATTVAFSDFRVVGSAKPIEASTTREHRANIVDFQPTSFRRTTETWSGSKKPSSTGQKEKMNLCESMSLHAPRPSTAPNAVKQSRFVCLRNPLVWKM